MQKAMNQKSTGMEAEQAKWLAEFVRSRRKQRDQFVVPPKDLVSDECIYLSGSIGYDAILCANSEIWVHQYDLVDLVIYENDTGEWHLASGNERLLMLVIAVKYFPELTRLLPKKQVTSQPCESCKGTGMLYNVVGCLNCGGLGWLPEDIQQT